MRQLCRQSHHGKTKLQENIHQALKQNVPFKRDVLLNAKYLQMDATYLHRRNSLLVLMNAQNKKIVCGQYDVRENSLREMTLFLQQEKLKGLSPESFTVDGNPTTISALKSVWPSLIIQRCLVHIQRQGLMWCRMNPKRTDAKKLRQLFLILPYIKTKMQAKIFILRFQNWENIYGTKIQNQPERGYGFADLKRARSLILKALPDMFHYLDNPQISSSTSALEGYFSRLKSKYRNHRGLAIKYRSNYFKWYFFLCPK